MRTKATVVALDGKYATVVCDRQSACDGCHKLQDGGDCSVCSLMGAGRSMQTKAYNEVDAVVGDIVEIESRTARVMWYAALVFVLPVIAVILGYLLGNALFGREMWGYICAVGAFVVTFIGIRLYSEFGLKQRTDVSIVAVVSRKSAD
jgi:sigma-E factor negative regulatory protein RseC